MVYINHALHELLLSYNPTFSISAEPYNFNLRSTDSVTEGEELQRIFSQFRQPLNVLREMSCQVYFQFCCFLYSKLQDQHILEPS